MQHVFKPHSGQLVVDDDKLEFPHPFWEQGQGEADEPRTLLELQMCALSSTLRAKPEWWRKYKDGQIRERWRQEALDQGLPQKQVDYVLDELAGYTAMRDEETGIEVSCHDKIWQSDSLIPQNLQDDLKDAVRFVEDVPEGDKDWHPRSNGLVLDLVHPSLYPLVYGRTFVHKHFDSRSQSVEHVLDNRYKEVYAELLNPAYWDMTAPALPSEPRDWRANHILKWLMRTDDDVKEDLWVSKAEEALKTAGNGRWKVLLPLLLPRNRPRGTCTPEPRPDATSVLSGRFAWLPTDFLVGSTGAKALGYINNIHPSHVKFVQTVELLVGAFVPLFERVLTDVMPGNALPLRHRLDGEDDESEDAALRVQRRAHRYSLRGRGIQVIVKLANITLTPEKPEYGGGAWHVEGMRNESIVASGIYYYDEENISESRLAFRTAVCEPDDYSITEEQDLEAWGIGNEGRLVQDLGSVHTRGGRCIAFPNIYQHCVSPFALQDRTRPGHRKILALFLVDPTRKIPSTSTVAPQQKELLVETLESCGGRLAVLPRELLRMIADFDTHTMTLAEARRYREELMDERTQFVRDNDEGFFGDTFNMCEH
ncbi:hypothetical protein EXIGLDRAFT_839044 [Exidia glandulosa HHB12029]|uniref:Uncharacterized protein n=1 Tax=Exidia glandulosa HHB12029 TaxID=1314781 RepID=A0A165FAF9_EXIGL|nr:hypothetical protein EXIGLDRAFT_839044 [Exidia glandulosa HHB12029]